MTPKVLSSKAYTGSICICKFLKLSPVNALLNLPLLRIAPVAEKPFIFFLQVLIFHLQSSQAV